MPTSGFNTYPPVKDDIVFAIDITQNHDLDFTGLSKEYIYEHYLCDPTKMAFFPRVRNSFRFENKPMYANEELNQAGAQSLNFIRLQREFSNLSFDPCTVEHYRSLISAMNIRDQFQSGGFFRLYYFDFCTNTHRFDWFIAKALPIVVLTKSATVEKIQLDNIKLQEQ